MEVFFRNFFGVKIPLWCPKKENLHNFATDLLVIHNFLATALTVEKIPRGNGNISSQRTSQ